MDLAGIGDWFAGHSRHIGLAAIAIAVMAPAFASASLWRKQKDATGWLRAWVWLELVIVWAIPVVASLAWFAADRASDVAEKKWKSERSKDSNEIAQLKKVLKAVPQNLYSKMVYETIPLTDTNRVRWRRCGDGSRFTCVQLRSAPVPGSLKGEFKCRPGLIMATPPFSNPLNPVRNILLCKLGLEAQWDQLELAFEYVSDTDETNPVRRIEFVSDDAVILDQTRVTFATR